MVRRRAGAACTRVSRGSRAAVPVRRPRALERPCAARERRLPRARPPMCGSRATSSSSSSAYARLASCVSTLSLRESRGLAGAFARTRGSNCLRAQISWVGFPKKREVYHRDRDISPKGTQRSSKEWIGNSPDLHNARSKACMLGSLAELRRADDTCRAKTGIGGSGFAHGAVCVACSPARPGSCISRLRRRPCWRARSFARATGSVHAVGCCGRFRSARKKAAAFRRPPSCVDVIDPMSLCDC